MFGRRKNRQKSHFADDRRPAIEPLESRQLLSTSAASIVLHSDAVFMRSAATSQSSIQGYTPAQIRAAYNFDQLTLSNGAAADGTGQTIAIVDAYNDPNIVADLGVFDAQFGLSAPPSLKVVNQNGGSTLPTTDAGWDGEISLDVEWAHAMAPGANILLVEATSASLTNLIDAVNEARNAAGVSVISMSWGGSEFFSFNGTEFTGQTQYDPYFTTPTGHQGETFVAAAGDSGAFSGVQWPASSPNVLSVGGTSLYTQDQSGTYYTESSWSGTSGGFSQVEVEPSYQATVQNTGVRTVPDVAYDADPNTGFAVYDSVSDQGYVGWQEVGGTSAGAPQWAAIIAIANQARVLAGKATLDGVSQTLPALYDLYSAPGSSDYSTYTSYFNDVVDYAGGGGRYHWRFGGYGYSNPATLGYDVATGLGTPKTNNIVTALTAVTGNPTTGGSGTTGGSNPGGSSAPSQLAAPTLTGMFLNSPVAPAVDGASGSVRVRVTNTGTSRFTGPVSITLYASSSASTDSASLANDTFLATVNLPNVNLAAGAWEPARATFKYPSTLDGTYYIVASIQELGMNTAPAVAVTATAVEVSAPFIDLAAIFAASQPITVNPGHSTTVVLTIENLGNVTAIGTINASLYASSSQTLNTTTATFLASQNGRPILIGPGHSIRIRLTFQAPSTMSPGTYYLIASTSSATQPADSNSSNNVAVINTQS
jgi:subtilase family serine protease